MFVTSEGSAGSRFVRAVRSRNLFLAETAAFEMATLSLGDALALVVLYGEAQDDKFEKAAVRWLGRLLLEKPMPLSLAARCIELVAELRGPGRSGPRTRSTRSSLRRGSGPVAVGRALCLELRLRVVEADGAIDADRVVAGIGHHHERVSRARRSRSR